MSSQHPTATRLAPSSLYPIEVEQRTPPSYRDAATIAKLKVRNVADKRAEDGHEAHVELSIVKVHASRLQTSCASVALSPDDAIDFAAALLGIGPNRLRTLTAGDRARREEERGEGK